MGRTHKLPSPRRRRSGAMWQMTDNLQSGLRCSLWLGLTFFSHSIREFQDVLLKVQPWVGRMSSSWGSSAFDGGDHDNRVFTVSVSLHRITCKKTNLLILKYSLHCFYLHQLLWGAHFKCSVFKRVVKVQATQFHRHSWTLFKCKLLFFETSKVNQTFACSEGGGMSGWRLSRDPQEKTSLRGGSAMEQPTSSWGRRVGSHLRVGGEGRLLPKLPEESLRAEETSASSGWPEFTEGWCYHL